VVSGLERFMLITREIQNIVTGYGGILINVLYNKIFSGDQTCQYGTTVQRFRDHLCLHHQGMM
jgi:hypothetical protein